MAESSLIRPLVAGNWKMNGVLASLGEVKALTSLVASAQASCDILVCPPFTLLTAALETVQGSEVAIGAQDCHANTSGAHTGDVSADMISDLGASYVIIGHSERRADHGETSANVAAKAEAALSAGLTAIICVGETCEERDAGETLAIIDAQLEGSLPKRCDAQNVVIAYEPVWAIGTGLTPSVDDVAQVHTHIRARLETLNNTGAQMRILYGGSVKPSNAAELMGAANVNGALVGGASLKATDFNGIIDAYRR